MYYHDRFLLSTARLAAHRTGLYLDFFILRSLRRAILKMNELLVERFSWCNVYVQVSAWTFATEWFSWEPHTGMVLMAAQRDPYRWYIMYSLDVKNVLSLKYFCVRYIIYLSATFEMARFIQDLECLRSASNKSGQSYVHTASQNYSIPSALSTTLLKMLSWPSASGASHCWSNITSFTYISL